MIVVFADSSPSDIEHTTILTELKMSLVRLKSTKLKLKAKMICDEKWYKIAIRY